MEANDVENNRVGRPEKKSLLERYDIPVEHLSYEYISECTNGKKLERLVTILRSGEEGYYPDLTKHAEERLAVVKPTSTVLRKTEPILRRSMLEPSECKKIDTDINDWTSEMQSREKDLEEGKATLDLESLPQPDVRQFIEEPVKKSITNTRSADKIKRIASCDYSAWDKYDVDTELNKIDIRDEQRLVEAKRIQLKQKGVIEKKKLDKQTIINKSSLTGTEINVMAEQEREKGNEAFRSRDYEEALEHYNTSIKIDSNITAYNNRAITYIKLQQYEKALNDCNIVLSIEYTNIKALLRRAMALEHLENPSKALADYEAVLRLEPTNPSAIAGVKKLRKPCRSKKVRMAIVEHEGRNEGESNEVEKDQSFCQQFASKLAIENNICFCDRAPGPSQNLRPRPHFKADYCLENDNSKRVAIENDTSKKAESSEILTSCNFPQERNSSFAKPKSIFSYAMPSKRGNSVIIEELPNEPCNNNSIIVESKSVETTVGKNDSNTNTENKKKICENVEDVNKNRKENCNLINGMSSSRKMPIAEEYENCISKNFNNIESTYEFTRVWRSLKNDFDLEMHARLLRSVDVDKLGAVLGNELDGNMFSTILRCLERHFCTPNDTELLNNFLNSVTRVNRFSIVNMFMDTEDKTIVTNILNFLEEHGTSGVSSLRRIYRV